MGPIPEPPDILIGALILLTAVPLAWLIYMIFENDKEGFLLFVGFLAASWIVGRSFRYFCEK
jgi:hypothetical protein